MRIILSKKTILSTAVTTAVALFAFGSGSVSHAEESAAFDSAQKTAIENIIKEYLVSNPEVIFEAVDAHREKQEQEQRAQAENAIGDNIDALTSGDAPSIGPADADVTVVEFFDYNCGYCKRVVPDIQAAVKDDPKVRFVFKEMPILGPTSRTAAQWALAANKQGKYFEYHVALMEHRGPKEDEQLSKLAKDLGLNVDKMKVDAASDEVQAQIDADVALAKKIGINGTPAFIVGKTLFPGYIGKDGLVQSIADERKRQGEDG